MPRFGRQSAQGVMRLRNISTLAVACMGDATCSAVWHLLCLSCLPLPCATWWGRRRSPSQPQAGVSSGADLCVVHAAQRMGTGVAEDMRCLSESTQHGGSRTRLAWTTACSTSRTGTLSMNFLITRHASPQTSTLACRYAFLTAAVRRAHLMYELESLLSRCVRKALCVGPLLPRMWQIIGAMCPYQL